VIGIEKVAAMRWIDFPDIDTVELEIHARLASVDPQTGVHRVAVEILAHGRPNASATVLLGDRYREDVRLEFSSLSHPRPWPLTAEDIYTERHMFHGPRFHCVSDMQVLGDEGLIGEITLQPRDDLFDWTTEPLLVLDPVVLDGVVQLVAMWVIVNGAFLMPAKITRLEFYRPSPPPGTRVPVRVEIRNVDSQGRTVTADVEVGDGEGNVWFRVEGVNEWLYEYAPRLQDTHRLPTRYHLAEPLALAGAPPDSVTALVSSADLRHSNKEWLARLYLTQEEWLYFKELPTLHKQLRWLMGRIAAKDAARIWMAPLTGPEMLHPALLTIAVDEAGKPYACPMAGDLPAPEISIAHTDGFAVAMAAPASCGIDLEPRDRDVRSVLASFANEEEISLVDAVAALAEDPSWPLRLWCAKEAVAKTIGSGLQGRPKDFEMIDVDEEGQLLIQHRPTQESYVVRTCLDDMLVYAHTWAGDVGPSGAANEFLGNARMPTQRSLP
jgi:phosphopantetheinyl transferase